MSFVPGLGLAKGMALTLRRFFEPKVTVKYPEERYEVAPRFRGRLQLLYDEYGTLKCETCFQCAQACPIECIDMGGIDSRGRYHVHWGPPETYGERREESALRRSGRPVPDAAYRHFQAIELTPVGSEGSVTVGLAREGGRAILTVADTGVGIPAEDIPRVFERFYRADPARARDPGGTGLGLSIAQWIVQQHHGEITVVSEARRGTTVRVRLPVLS